MPAPWSQNLTLGDLDRCAALDQKWKKLGLDSPLFLLESELARARDAFPLELSEIIATRRVVFGTDLFEGITVPKADLRRACEVQARGHVLHLREGYIEAARRSKGGRQTRRCGHSGLSRAGHKRRAAGRHLAQGARHPARPGELRKGFSGSAHSGRTARRLRGPMVALNAQAFGDSGLGVGDSHADRADARTCRTQRASRLLASAYAQQPPPELTRPVNDFANVIDQENESEIERRILALKQASGDVVVVATIETFAPYADLREYAVRMFENRGRGIGEKGKDNGLLVLLAVKDRRVRMEVGYDLEQFITDGYAGEVSRTVMAPYFARGEYGAGLLDRCHTSHRADCSRTRRDTHRCAASGAGERLEHRVRSVAHHRHHHHRSADEQRGWGSPIADAAPGESLGRWPLERVEQRGRPVRRRWRLWWRRIWRRVSEGSVAGAAAVAVEGRDGNSRQSLARARRPVRLSARTVEDGRITI